MKTAFLFPGQGAEARGLGCSGSARALIERASRALEMDLAEAIHRGSPALFRTEVAQVALTATSIGGAQDLMAAGVQPDVVAGHSVGELAAFCIAGCIDPADAIDCAVSRGKLMAAAARRSPGGMAAVRIREIDLFEVLRAAEVDLAACNAPDELVVSGSRAALAQVAARFPSMPLPAAGPWHSRAMAEAESSWREELRAVRFRRPQIPLVANATGALVVDEDLAGLLAGQLTRPVQWERTMRTLAGIGVSTWRAIGPGRVLRGLCRKNFGADVRVEIDA